MTITETNHTTPRGRPRAYDEDTMLNALTQLFWDKGYEATSMSDVVRVSGVNKSSLYNAYGSKRDLFRLVLSRYVAQRMEALGHLASQGGGDGVQPMHGFLAAIGEFGRNGCLAVNTSTELGVADAEVVKLAQDYRDRTRAAVHNIVSAVTLSAGLSGDLVESRSDMLLAFLLGFSVAVRGGASDSEMDRYIQAAHRTVESWLDKPTSD